ncbi:MAG: hypothetical protein ACK5KP_11480 [Paludibacteraceae bacterium]
MRKTILVAFLFCLTVGTLSAKRPKKIQKAIVDSIETTVKTDSVNAKHNFPMVAIGNIRFSTDTVHANLSSDEIYTVDTLNRLIYDKNRLTNFFIRHVVYPNALRYQEAESFLTIRFDIDNYGNVINPKVMNAIHPEMEQEVLRVTACLPEFIVQSSKEKSTMSSKTTNFKAMTVEIPIVFKMLKL